MTISVRYLMNGLLSPDFLTLDRNSLLALVSWGHVVPGPTL